MMEPDPPESHPSTQPDRPPMTTPPTTTPPTTTTSSPFSTFMEWLPSSPSSPFSGSVDSSSPPVPRWSTSLHEMSEPDVHRMYTHTITSLQVLTHIRLHDRLSTSQGMLTVEPNSMFQGLYRRFKGDTRMDTVRELEKLLGTVKLLLFYYAKQYTSSMECSQHFHSLFDHTKRSLDGLKNLAETYQSDAHVCSRIKTCMELLQQGMTSSVSIVEWTTTNPRSQSSPPSSTLTNHMK